MSDRSKEVEALRKEVDYLKGLLASLNGAPVGTAVNLEPSSNVMDVSLELK